jgi:hypothetical protein
MPFQRSGLALLSSFGLILSWTACGFSASKDQSLKAYPSQVELRGPDAVQQIAVNLTETSQIPVDRTSKSNFQSANTKVVEVDSTGLIVAKGDGETVVTISFDGLETKVSVVVRSFAHAPPMNFANDVVPIFTKLGCNSGGCHGKALGQNGFRLSLLGFEPSVDLETLVHEGRGRRLFPTAPSQSLLLQKAIAKVPHGGGKRMEESSHEYRVILRWIQSGMPVGRPDDASVERVEIEPATRVMARGTTQQVVATAVYTDGHREDVTRWAQYQSNDADVAEVAEGGQVHSLGASGQAAVMARYQGKVAVFRATVPRGVSLAQTSEFKPTNRIDEFALKQWQALGLQPSAPCTDSEFIRRASLDLTGSLPKAAETQAFVADKRPNKRAILIDDFLERPEYASFFAIKWADILRNKRDGKPEAAFSTFRFHDWIRESLAKNVPYDRFVREVITATGTPETSPAVMWYRKKKKTDEYVDDTAQVFLGMRLQCAKCHHHPFEVWSQDDYYGFAAFFGKLKRKPGIEAGTEEVIYSSRTGTVTHPKSGKAMQARGLGDPVATMTSTDDPRRKLSDWLSNPANPYFARALVNRYWAHFFGRGIVEPLDDMRVTNPPTNPELLDAVSDAFVKSGYDLKGLVRMIAKSQIYGLSSIPNETNATDKQSFARHYPRRVGAEVLLDAISQMTASPTAFAGLPPGTRAIDLPDEAIVSGFLDAFGRPKRDTACECERVSDASLGQSLMMLNSADVQAKLGAAGGRAELLAKDPRPDEVKLVELFWDAFSRPPSSSETAAAVAHLASNAAQKKSAYEDILWALLNAKEFQFND